MSCIGLQSSFWKTNHLQAMRTLPCLLISEQKPWGLLWSILDSTLYSRDIVIKHIVIWVLLCSVTTQRSQ